MKGESVLYQGRLTSPNNFRTYVYSKDGQRKLVNSWEEFTVCMHSGFWCANRTDALNPEVFINSEEHACDKPVIKKKTRHKKEAE